MQEENAEPGDNHCGQGQHDDLLRADLVVHPPERHGRQACNDVRGDREDHDLARAETEGRLGQNRSEGEDAGQAVTEDGGGDEEEEGVRASKLRVRTVRHSRT